MLPSLQPDHLLEIIVRGDDNPLLLGRPLKDIAIRHPCIFVNHLNHVVAGVFKRLDQDATGVYVDQKPHLRRNPVEDCLAGHQVMGIEQRGLYIIWL